MSNASKHIVLIEDEEHLHETLKLNLELEGYTVSSAFNGREAIQLLHQVAADLVILDIMLPEVDGYSIIEHLRLNNIQTPILVLSAKNTSENRVHGLKLGADDYLTKPFNLEELLLRVGKLLQKNILQSASASSLHEYSFADHTIHFDSLEVKLASGETIQLTKTEGLLLKLLIENKNTVVSREKILQSVWGYQVFPNTRTIDNFIANFRNSKEL